MLELGWPDPAAVLQRMASTRSCWASSWMAARSSAFTSVVTPTSYPTDRGSGERRLLQDGSAVVSSLAFSSSRLTDWGSAPVRAMSLATSWRTRLTGVGTP